MSELEKPTTSPLSASRSISKLPPVEEVEDTLEQLEKSVKTTSKKEERKHVSYGEVSIEIKDNEIISTPSERRGSSKTIVKNMLKTRSRNNSYKSPSVNVTTSPNDSPSLEYKPYENMETGYPNLWTDEVVQQLIDFGEICTESSIKCKKSSIKHRRIGHFIQISVISLGALAAATSIGTATNQTKEIISTISGTLIAIFTSIQSFLKFPQQAEVEASSTLELERMARSVRIELSKSKELRVDPYKFIIKLENQREKILHKIGIEDD
jgi:hypothetical protein